MTAEVATLVARPPSIPAEISDAQLMAAVREYLHGGEIAHVAASLGFIDASGKINTQAFLAMTKGVQWKSLQNHFGSEFIATTGARMIRLENMILDKLESYVETGITCWAQTKDGEAYSYQREVSPKELVSVGLLLNTQNKRLDELKDVDKTRKGFDQRDWLQRMENATKKLQEKEIPGSAVREAE